jgi:hypothetical protein
MTHILLVIAFSKPALYLVGLATGFGIGRIKNAKKLAAIRAAVNTVTAAANVEARQLATDVKAKL